VLKTTINRAYDNQKRCAPTQFFVRCMREQEMASKSGTGAPLLGGGSEVKPLLGSGEKESGACPHKPVPVLPPSLSLLSAPGCGGGGLTPRRVAPPAVLLTARNI
jgi:hypothetical protein